MLNLKDALILAGILNKYINEQSMEKDAITFIAEIVDRIAPQEYLLCVKLLTGKSTEDIAGQMAIDTLTEFINGLKENQILALISFYKSLGFN